MKGFLMIGFLITMMLICTSTAVYETPPQTTVMTIPAGRMVGNTIQIIEIPLYVSRLDFLVAVFTEPFEMALFIFNDLKMYFFTNKLEG